MAGENFRLGDIDCLQQMRVPNALGDTPVRMVYPDYQDSHFAGLGLQADYMPLDVHEALFHRNGVLAYVRHKILERVGYWQVECPAMRENGVEDPHQYFRERLPVSWHTDRVDFEDKQSFNKQYYRQRALLVNNQHLHQPYGETNFTTKRVFLHMESTQAESTEVRLEIQKILNENTEYDPEFESSSLIEYCYPNRDSSVDAQNNDTIVRQFYMADDPSRPADIQPYSTIAWCEHGMMHAASNAASGRFCDRDLYVPNVQQ